VPEFMLRDTEYRAFVWQILVEASQSDVFNVRTTNRSFRFSMFQQRVYRPKLPKVEIVEESIYYGGGYTMNREAIA
jgi:hypothetical protein